MFEHDVQVIVFLLQLAAGLFAFRTGIGEALGHGVEGACHHAEVIAF